MNEADRQFFDGRCPYTDKPCETDIDCLECETNAKEVEYMNELYEEVKTDEEESDSE